MVDFGSHSQTLEGELEPGTRYTPCDCVGGDDIDPASTLTKAQRDRVVVLDLNADRMPPFGADACTFLGVLEYLTDVPGVLAQARAQFRTVVISYNVCKAKSLVERRLKDGWMSHLSQDEIEGAFRASGFRIAAFEQIGERQMMWKLV